MGVFSDIQNAFTSYLADMENLPPVGWENVKFTPVHGETHLVVYLLPGTSEIADTSGKMVHVGVFQIDVKTATGVGVKPSNDMADALEAYFKEDVELEIDSGNVWLRGASRGKGDVDGAWYKCPVDVYYICYEQ